MIRQVLHREHYRGFLVNGKTKWVKRRGTKIKIQCPESEWRRYEAPGPAIIPGDLWEAVQSWTGSPGCSPSGGPRGTATASPIVSPACSRASRSARSAAIASRSTNTRARGRPVYRCSWNNERGKHGCATGTSIPIQAAEEAVLNTLLCDVLEAAVIIRHLDEVRERALEEAAKPEGVVEREHLTAEIQRLDREIGNLVARAAHHAGLAHRIEHPAIRTLLHDMSYASDLARKHNMTFRTEH